MNSRIDKLLILCLIFVISLCSSIYSNEDKWKIEIELAKQDYVLHERIWLDVTLTNNILDTQRTHGLDTPNHRQFFIMIKDSNGELLDYTGSKFTLASGHGNLLIETEEQDFGSFNLTELYGSTSIKSGYTIPDWLFPYIPIGTYTVQVLFEDYYSNELTFNVVEPFGNDREVLELIEEAHSVYSIKNTDPSVQIYREIVDRFPNSVFAVQCYYFTIAYLQETIDMYKQGTISVRYIHKEMLEKYPNSGRAKSWLLSITRDLEDEEKIELFNKYFEENPNTRCAKFAKQMKKRILKNRGE